MKRKLKSLTACLLLTLCFMMTACVSDPERFYFDYNELKDTVVAVELIDYDNPNAKTVKKRADILPFDFDKMEIVETLESGQSDNFLSDLSEMHFHVRDNLTRYLSSATGISVRIVYESGNFVVICLNQEKNFAGEFTEDGNACELMLYFVGSSDFPNFPDFVNKYFITQTN